VRLDTRARAVGREREQRRGAGEVPDPVAEPGVEQARRGALLLPHRVVGVLHGQLFKRRVGPAREGVVEDARLADEHPHRPAVADDVVHGHEQEVMVGTEPHESGAQQRPGREVEGARGFGIGEAAALGLAPLFGERGEVGERERDVERRGDELAGPPALGGEGRAQSLVPRHHRVDASLKCQRVEFAVEMDGPVQIVERAFGLELVEEPEALLGEGEGHRLGAGDGDERRPSRLGLAHRPLDECGQTLHRGRLEDVAQRQFNVKGFAQTRDKLRGQQRVSARVEEVVFDADALDAEHLGPHPAQQLLDRRPRRDVAPRQSARAVGRGQRAAVDLPVGRQRQTVERDEGRRDHVLRQHPAQVPPQLGRPGHLAPRDADQVGHEPRVAHPLLAPHHYGPPHARVGFERGLDLSRLDPEPPQLDLLVGTPDEHQLAPRQVARQVSRPVQTRPRLRGEQVGDKLLGRQLWAVQVSAGHPLAADVEFADDAHRHGL
jgi:hypothetical protein